ncbi:DUF2955 domain-containing protein [Luteimonas sp. A482]
MSPASSTTIENGRADARVHATLRFATGVTGAFVACEAMQWAPTFLAPVLACVLLANLPMRPPLKMGVALVLTMAAAAALSFVLATLLRGIPLALFGLVALIMFLSFLAIAAGRPALPFTLLLLCLSTIPVVVLVAPAHGTLLPVALVRGMALALLAVWVTHAVWTCPPARSPVAPRGGGGPIPVASALMSVVVVMPVMLVYLLFGLADVLPVLVTTVILVINFDVRRGRLQASAMILGNFLGGLLGLLLHAILLTTPSLPFLALMLFVVTLGFGQRIAAGGAAAAVAVITCNAMLIIFSSAIASGPGSLPVWLARLSQFAIAGAFAVAMMTLVWHRAFGRHAPVPADTVG